MSKNKQKQKWKGNVAVSSPATGKTTVKGNRGTSYQVSAPRLFDFSSTAMNSKTTTLKRKGEEPTIPDAPIVYYMPDVWDQLQFIIQESALEVGWLGLVSLIPEGYVVTKIFVPEQTVSGSETDIGEDAMTALALEIVDQHDISQLYYWGHSHVNMSVSPSNQDERQIDTFLEHCPVFIRGIYNKKGDSKVDVYWRDEGLVFQCVDDLIFTPGLTEKEQDDLDALLEKNVKTRAYASRTPTHQGQPWFGGAYQGYSWPPPKDIQDDDDDDDTTPNIVPIIDEDEMEFIDDIPEGYAYMAGVGLVSIDDEKILTDPFGLKEN